jgi:hypothetical protein
MPKPSIESQAWVKRTLLSGAVAGLIAFWVGLLVVLLAAISSVWLNDNLFLLFFVVLLPIGACGFLLRRRLNSTEEVRIEANRWLAERNRIAAGGRQRRQAMARRWALWIPTLLVLGVSAFPEQMLAVASRLFHPHSGRVLGYQVSIPSGWVITMSEADVGNRLWSVVAADRYSGINGAGIAVWLGRQPSLRFSHMAFYGAPLPEQVGDAFPSSLDVVVSSETLSFGAGTITCWRCFPSYIRQQAKDFQYVRCSTAAGDFRALFSGDQAGEPDFYRALQTVRKTR